MTARQDRVQVKTPRLRPKAPILLVPPRFFNAKSICAQNAWELCVEGPSKLASPNRLEHKPSQRSSVFRENIMLSNNKIKDEQLQSAKEIAFLLGISDRTISNWAQKWHQSAGLTGIPAMKVGKLWRFRYAEVLEWLEAQHHPHPTSVRRSKKHLPAGAGDERIKNDEYGRWADDGGNDLD